MDGKNAKIMSTTMHVQEPRAGSDFLPLERQLVRYKPYVCYQTKVEPFPAYIGVKKTERLDKAQFRLQFNADSTH